MTVSYEAMLGDTLVDWLAEGGQTMHTRALWESRVGLPTTVGLMSLIVIADRDDGAAVHQGNFRWVSKVRCGVHFTLPQ